MKSDLPTTDRPMRRLFQFLGSYRSNLLTSVSYSIVHKLFDLMPPFLTAWLIDSVAGNVPSWIPSITGTEDPWQIIVFICGLTVVVFCCESFTEWRYKLGFMRLAQRVQHDLRLHTYHHLQSREVAFFENERTGNLMSILNDDINQLERFLNNSFNEILQMIILVIVASWSLYITAPLLGLIGSLPIPLIILASFWYQRKVAPYYKEVRQMVGNLSNRLENNISGVMVIKSFAAEEYELERVRQSSEAYRDANFKAINWSAVYIPLIRIIIAIGFAGTLLLGSYQVFSGEGPLTLGGLAFFAMMIQRLLWPVTGLGRLFDDYERARASSRRVFALIDSESLIQEHAEADTQIRFKGTIDFQEVSFAYQPPYWIIKDLNLHIAPGQTLGIAGITGAGKTTLIKLLLRFYDVNKGKITIDRVDLKMIGLKALRSQIGLVSQSVYLFHGNFKENIAYGQDQYAIEAIQDAAKKAQIHDFILSLPNGYDTIIGERGIKLSGGQRQRLSIARAILKDAPILLLDEATSAVDTETERAIQENLEILTKNKTAIIIAHRLSTIRRAEKIIVLKDGQLAEEGTHDQLVTQNGLYADLWKVQLGEIETGKD